ncbi:hypothetical protein PHMEG_00041468 [Phytophthora megakarya]|uniref:Uncharacterized protein n=1 Tax=Phytophthora megakarya TaxID=4795 RepID=A0A225UBL5_9STRA|nr:hypothetical protein PHMEG_00041468 [Phytophthora megakarya]
MFKLPRGLKVFKFLHLLMGPLRVVDSAGYHNYVGERSDDGDKYETFIAHASLVTYRYPVALLDAAAIEIATTARGTRSDTVGQWRVRMRKDGVLVELRYHRRRNKAGQYVLEYCLQPRELDHQPDVDTDSKGGHYWVPIREYVLLCDGDKVVEDLGVVKGV